MADGTNRPIKDSERIAQAEREIADLKRTVANLLRAKPRTHWSQVRLAQTIAADGYGGSGQRHPIVFVDAAWDTVNEDVDVTPKSAELQAYALSVSQLTMPIGTQVFVEQTEKGTWLIIEVDAGLGLGQTQTGGIAEGDVGTVTAKVLNSDGSLSTALDEDSNPIEEEVYSPLGTIAESRTIAYGRDKRSGRLFAIAEKCPA